MSRRVGGYRAVGKGRSVFVASVKESEMTQGSTKLRGVASQIHPLAQFEALQYKP
jgi:hypothetical protein